MTKTNEYGAELFITAMAEYETGNGNVQEALRTVAKAYGQMHKAIVKANGGSVPSTTRMANALKDKLTGRGRLASNTSKWIEDRNQRIALLWMSENPKQVEYVFGFSEASTPRSIKQAWDIHFRKAVKLQWDENEAEGHVHPKDVPLNDLPAVTRKDIENEWNRLDSNKVKRLKKQAEDAPAPATPEQEVSAIKAAIDHADLEELNLLEGLLQKRREKLLAELGPEFKLTEAPAELTAAFKAGGNTFGIYKAGQPDEPYLTFEVDAEKKAIFLSDQNRTEVRIKSASATNVRAALANHFKNAEGVNTKVFGIKQ